MYWQELEALGISFKGNRAQQKVKCPECPNRGKQHLNDTPLSVDASRGVYNCHKCNWKGTVAKTEFIKHEPMIEYKLPEKKNITKLSDKVVDFFESRKISQSVLIKNKIASDKNGNAVFPYLRDGVLVNYKIRSITEKKFFQAAEAEPIMFNLDRIKNAKEIIVCEGEIDAMSWEVAGYENHTSVNQGAPNVADTNIDKKLECITNCYDVFEQAETIYIAVDKDPNGKRLETELIRRFGAEKCKIVDFEDCKDANEYLEKHGSFDLSQLLVFAKEVRIDGVFTAQDNFDSMMSGFVNGQRRGESTRIDVIDTAWKWRRGEVTIWTGYQNEGKSLMLNQLSVIKSFWDGDKFAVFSPENMPMDDFYNDLAEMYIGKTTDPYYGDFQMSKNDYIEAISFLDKNFFLILPEDDFTLDTLFTKVKYLIKRYGITHFIIDPYNTVEHFTKGGETIDLYVSRFMGKLKQFAVRYDIGIHLVAHQLTARKNKDDNGRYHKPDLNQIKGGGTFADKADNVIMIWRPERANDFRDPKVVFGSQKIKKQKLVARPSEIWEIEFDFKSNRYFFDGNCPFDKMDNERQKRRNGDFELAQEQSPFPLQNPDEAFDTTDNDEVPF